MKKVVVVVCFLIMSTFLKAEQLECERNFPKYQEVLDEEIILLKNGDLNKLTQYYEKNNYSSLFNHKHNNQRYKYYRWIDLEKYEAESNDFLNSMKDGTIEIVKYKMGKPISNQMTSVGEICVFPISLELKLSGEMDVANGNIIFIRGLIDNKWRFFDYNSKILEDDFNEFFPDFPKDVLLKIQR